MGPTSYTWSFITPINGLRNGVTGVINTTYHGNRQPSCLIIFGGYGPIFLGLKPSFFMVLGSKGIGL